MTPTNKTILFATALAASAPVLAFNDCALGQCGTRPGNTTTTVTGTAAPTGIATAAPKASAAAQAAAQAAATAAAQAAAQAAQNLEATQQQQLIGRQDINGRQTQTQGNVSADARAVGGNQTITGDTVTYQTPRIPVAQANPGVAIAAGLCGFSGGVGGQGVTIGLSMNISGQNEDCRRYFMLLANNQPEAATVYGMQNIPGMAQAINGAADVEEAVAAKPELVKTRYIRFRSIKVNPLLNQQ